MPLLALLAALSRLVMCPSRLALGRHVVDDGNIEDKSALSRLGRFGRAIEGFRGRGLAAPR